MQQWGIESNADKVAMVGAAALGGAIVAQGAATLVKRILTGKRLKDSGQNNGNKVGDGTAEEGKP